MHKLCRRTKLLARSGVQARLLTAPSSVARTYTRLARSDHKNVRGGALAAKKSAALPPPFCGLLAPPRMRAQQSKKLAAISSSSACSGSILKSGKLPLLPVCLSL